MSRSALVRLINSLSKSEKRHFKLSTKKQSGNKEYLDLFEIIEKGKSRNIDSIELEFKKKHPKASLDNAARYLIQILTDCLIQSKVKEDHFFQILHGLMRVNLLKERSLQEESFKELQKLKQQALKSQNLFLLPLINRHELNYLSDINFPDLSEKNLVEMQMKARDVLKTMRNTHEHYSLYELLKFRMINSGKVLSEEDKKRLNDLILSEMSLVTGRIKNNFEAKKLHLLFHSFYFTDIGDYKSALKTFHELNRLFEQNVSNWNNPPLDYLSSLDGILDSLRTIRSYEEMAFYIEKMEQLCEPKHPEYFRFITNIHAAIYRLAMLIGRTKYKDALVFGQQVNPIILKMLPQIDQEKQNEFLFYLGLSYFHCGDYNKAQKYINQIILIGKINCQSVIYKASRLLSLIIHFECNNLDYLDYEIRSYKRTFQNKGKLLQTEKIIFKIIQLDSNIYNLKNQLRKLKLTPMVSKIVTDKYEMQLSKYFNFPVWIKNKLKLADN